ncbi:ABC-F family ATP-binding cassette domain-containing protein [Sciscionella marina]|uniref:ABC-F family ATP-binding cassette domain-containing protein n=1 Tax=Sciscionella marina TaxID=508770 RepID=UPI000379059C|nr:ABC-F family ATP-binding cassette domain-containing protein [Sciscionella marina]
MVNLVNLEAVHKSYGVRPLLDGVSLGIGDSDRIGVVGLNGGGKTTLLEVVARLTEPDEGRVSHGRDLRTAVVTQRTTLDPAATVREVVLDPRGFDAEHEWAADPHIRGVLEELGVAALGLERRIGELSGGERRRVELAAALTRELDLLVLDEPTNHLDVEGVRWLAEHLLARNCALLVVTHDRWFLDTVCTRTWEVVDGRVESYEGGYSDWTFARAERARLADSAEEKRRNLARKELAWLRRGPQARSSKPRYRVEAAEALIADVPEPRDTVALTSFARRRLGKTVLELEDATYRIGERTMLDNETWRIGPGDRFGLVGVNGSGKTTMLRLLTGELEPESGRLVCGKTVRLAHLSQELAELDPQLRVLEAIELVASRVVLGKQELSASQLAERFGFGKSRQWTPVGDLSGGERRRLQLARLLMGEPNVLLLDEPTNDLDIDTLQQVEDLLDSWPGTLVVVSHDRYLIERVCDRTVALFGDGRITDLPGGIEEYLNRRKTLAEATPVNGKARKPESDAARQRAARKELAKLERRLDTLSAKATELDKSAAEAGADVDKLTAIDAELKAVRAERDEVEEQWLEAAERAE